MGWKYIKLTLTGMNRISDKSWVQRFISFKCLVVRMPFLGKYVHEAEMCYL